MIDIVHKADVNTDINTDRPENSASRNISDVNLDSRLREGIHVRKNSSNQCSERGQSCDQKRLICQSAIMNRHSAPRNIWDVNLFECNVQDTQEGQPMEGMTKSRQEDLSGFELAVAGTDKEQLPISYSLERLELIVSESQNYLKNTEEMQLSYDTGLSSRELEDAIRRGCFETGWWDRSIWQMRTFPWISSVRKDCGDGIWT